MHFVEGWAKEFNFSTRIGFHDFNKCQFLLASKSCTVIHSHPRPPEVHSLPAEERSRAGASPSSYSAAISPIWRLNMAIILSFIHFLVEVNDLLSHGVCDSYEILKFIPVQAFQSWTKRGQSIRYTFRWMKGGGLHSSGVCYNTESRPFTYVDHMLKENRRKMSRDIFQKLLIFIELPSLYGTDKHKLTCNTRIYSGEGAVYPEKLEKME